MPNNNIFYGNLKVDGLTGGTGATGYVFDVSGESRVSGNLTVTGSVRATTPISSTYVAQGKLAVDQSIPPGVDTVIQFVDDFDPQSWYDSSTYQFKPTIAGYYSVSAGAWLESPNSSTNQANLQMRVSGNTAAILVQPLNNGGVGQSLGLSKMVYLNGSTDYIDFTFYQGTLIPKNIQSGTASGSGTWFSAFLIAL